MKKRVISALLAFLLILTNNLPAVSKIAAEQNTTEDADYSYIGYQDGSTGPTQKLYVEKKGDSSVRRTVYCFNHYLHWPDTKATKNKLAYKKTTGSVTDFEGKVNEKSKYKGQELINKLKVVLLNGYPNANKIQNALKLTNDQMQKVTQMAVWHFTDDVYKNIGQLQSLNDTEALALATLIEMAEPIANGERTLKENVLTYYENEHKKTHSDYVKPESVDMPEKSTLDLYIQNGTTSSDGKGYQNLLGAHLINENTKEIIEIPKEKSKKEIKISKNGKEGPIGDAELSIAKADSPDTIIQTIKSSEESPSKIELEVDTIYILNEIKAPKGYQKITGVKFTVDSNGNITINEKGKYEDKSQPDDFGVSTYQNNLYITDKEKPEEPTPIKTKVIIRKYAKGDYKKLLEDAELELYKISEDEQKLTLVENGNFKSDNKGKEFELADGSYIIKEKTAPNGYKVADDINFEVKNGKVLIDDKEAPKGIEKPFSYEAYSDFNDDGEMVPGNPYGKFYYAKKEGKNQVVYCFNSTKHAPADSYDDGENIDYESKYGEVKYNKVINPAELYKYAQNPRIASAELATKVTRIIHAGYPNNKGNIDTRGLTKTQLRAGTQLAIYHYTDSAELTDEGLEKLGDGFQLLKGNGETESKIKDYAKSLINYSNSDQAPKDLTYDFYVANNGHYQNLIGTSYDPSDLQYVISMEDEQSTSEPEKPKSANIFFSKQDVLGNELKGASLQIIDTKTNKVIQEWVSNGSTTTFKLSEGNYKFVETAAPKGYKIATEINFAVDKNGKVTADGQSLKTIAGNNVIVMVDKYETIDKLVIKKVWKGKPADDLPIYFRLHKGVEGGDSSIEDPTVPNNLLNGKQNPIKYENEDIVIEGLSLPTIDKSGNKVKYSLTEVTLKNGLYTKWEKSGYETIIESKIEGNTLTFTVTNKEILKNVFFSKQDILGKELKGAKLQIKDKNTGEVVKEWTSGETPETFGLKPGKYEFVETAAPKGYKLATSIDFEITKDGEIKANDKSLKTVGSSKILVMVDDYKESKIFFSKRDILGEELPGAKLQIKNKETNEVVKEWTSSDAPNTFGLKPGKYEFVETAAPKGYKLATSIDFEITKDGEIKANDKSLKTVGSSKILVMVDDYKESKIFFSKRDILGKELPGAKLQIKDKKTGDVVKEWTSGETPSTFGLKPGSYEFVETAAPKGYKIATSIDFEITKDGQIKADTNSLKTVGSSKILVMVDDYKESKIFFSKRDILGKELPGAKLQIKEKETGDVVKEWTSGETPSTFALKPGKYEFKETAAPKGYKIATAIDFEITKDGEIKADTNSLKTVGSSKILVMVDDYKESKIFFSKRDILGKELPGAKLQIKEKETGDVVKEWTSGETPSTFALKSGSYEFVETAAPKGYKIATSIDFEITKDGQIKADTNSLKTVGSSKILVMVDDYKESKIFFSKRDILGKELPGAKLQIKEKETGDVVKEWTSGETPETFGLKPGKYEFVETAAPKGYKIATAIDFEITTDGQIKADKKSLKTVGSSNILVMVDEYEQKENENESGKDTENKPGKDTENKPGKDIEKKPGKDIEKESGKDKSIPKTNADSNAIYYLGIALLTSFGLLIVSRKNKNI